MLNRFMADRLFAILERAPVGRFVVETPDGKVHHLGQGSGELVATMHMHDWRVIGAFLKDGEIGLTETYRDGLWDTPDLTSLLQLGLANMDAIGKVVRGGYLQRLFSRITYRMRENHMRGSRRNIQAHYDLGNDFYKLWLDPGMTYSSALFDANTEKLSAAQDNKYDRILELLETDRGSMLEIGCGWGGFADRALQRADYDYRGITLSDQQHQYATERLKGSGKVVLEDYRLQESRYDSLVSIEMFEAVGEKYWGTYFSKLKSLLATNGKAMVQTITIRDENFETYRRRGDMIRTFIFPGGMLPSPSRFKQEAEKAGLRMEDRFDFGQDYAQTLKHWLQAFEQRLDEVRTLGFDEGFIRVWRFYLCACIAAFSNGSTNVMQVRLGHA